MAFAQQQQDSFLDALYCEEEVVEDEVFQAEGAMVNGCRQNPSLFSLLEEDLFWEDEELSSLFSKEQEQQRNLVDVGLDTSLCSARKQAVEWMLKVNSFYGFSALTAILAMNYLDRFLSSSYYQKAKPWMIQLLAVTCLSLAAKVEETRVPLLLDLQVEDTKYVFEAKTIQRMELLVLSALKWKMHLVTPHSFLDHIIRRLGLKTHLHWEFLRRCERLLISVVSDSRSVGYLPSVLATATMMHVIDQVEPFNAIDHQNQLLNVLKISKAKVNECYELIHVIELSKNNQNISNDHNKKRKLFEGGAMPLPSSPGGVIDSVFRCDSSNDSWALATSVSSSPAQEPQPLFKKTRTQDQWVFVDIVGTITTP